MGGSESKEHMSHTHLLTSLRIILVVIGIGVGGIVVGAVKAVVILKCKRYDCVVVFAKLQYVQGAVTGMEVSEKIVVVLENVKSAN